MWQGSMKYTGMLSICAHGCFLTKQQLSWFQQEFRLWEYWATHPIRKLFRGNYSKHFCYSCPNRTWLIWRISIWQMPIIRKTVSWLWNTVLSVLHEYFTQSVAGTFERRSGLWIYRLVDLGYFGITGETYISVYVLLALFLWSTLTNTLGLDEVMMPS